MFLVNGYLVHCMDNLTVEAQSARTGACWKEYLPMRFIGYHFQDERFTHQPIDQPDLFAEYYSTADDRNSDRDLWACDTDRGELTGWSTHLHLIIRYLATLPKGPK